MSQFTRDQLRTGAALVQAIKAGGEDGANARLLLADFIEEYGMPNRAGMRVGNHIVKGTIEELRRAIPEGESVGDNGRYGVSVDALDPQAMYCHYWGPGRRVWVGTWPLSAWLGE